MSCGPVAVTLAKLAAAALGLVSIFALVLIGKVDPSVYVPLVVSGIAALGGHASKGNANGS